MRRIFVTKSLVSFTVGVLLLPGFFWLSSPVSADSEIAQLQNQINAGSSRLSDIEREIARYEAELRTVGAERQTLQRAINQLELERRKVQAEIARTENLITSTDLEISKLILEINRTERDIASSQNAVASIIRTQSRMGDESLLMAFLQHDQLSDFWQTLESHTNVRNSLALRVTELSQLQRILTEQRSRSEAKRDELTSLKTQYSSQNQVLVNNHAEQAELLTATKNEEQNYQAMLASRRAAREQILREIRDFEAQLQFILDPNTIPAPGTPVFDWPVKNVVITQLFGGTEFARRNPSVYGGRAYHPGVDFGAPRGTPIHAPLAGIVRDVGNTDLVPGCFSWGKWTLIDHANGLSTLYAHKDVISVTPGQSVRTGEVIGYVGNTGFSTGPHLHFTVFVRDAVSVRRFNEIKTVTGCGAATTPVAATEAYLDPMLYLPPPTNVRVLAN